MKKVLLPSGEAVPQFGMGTWGMGEQRAARQAEIAAIRAAMERGVTLIDTAEMYGDGGAEEVLGEAIAGRRENLFLVSKVMPFNASLKGTIAACERSLRRLKTDCLDLYLLHWRGAVPFAETIAAFERLQAMGKIRHWGVSNLDMRDMDELSAIAGDSEIACNQLLYNLTRRGIEFDLLPRCIGQGVPVMAYSPIEQGRLLRHPALAMVAGRHAATPAQVALAWVMRNPEVIAIPKSSDIGHLEDNLGALDLQLDEADLADLDRAFPAPTRPRPLEML